MIRRPSVPSIDVPRRLPIFLLATAVVLALAGTSAVVVRATGEEGGPPEDPRRAAVEALARRPQDVASSARYLVRYAIENPGIRREYAIYRGEADFQRQRFRARARLLPEGRPARDADVFVFAQWQYERDPGGRWERRFLQPQNIGTPTPELAVVGVRGDGLRAPSYAGDLEVRRRIVDALVTDVVAVGTDDHHGDDVWHYRVTVDGARAAGRLPEPLLREMRGWEEGQRRRDLDLWLDGRGRLRRLSIFYADEKGRGPRVDNEFWDFGRPGRIDLPPDLGDPTAEGGEGVTSFTAPGIELDRDSPGFTVSVFSPDEAGDAVTLSIDDDPAPGVDGRRREFRIWPAAGRHLEPGEHRLLSRAEFNPPAPLGFSVRGPEVDSACPPDRPRSGTLTVVEAVRYEDRYYVRLHVRFTVRCQPPGGAPPVSVSGEARYYALT